MPLSNLSLFDPQQPALFEESESRSLVGMKPRALDFFAGAGLATEALKPFFQIAWANDIDPKKAAVYLANHPRRTFQLGGVEGVSGMRVPSAVLSWASFPCQDLSLAGTLGGIDSSRSGLVWQWLRVMDEMPQRPPIVVAENVFGWLGAANGQHYEPLHEALVARGYRVGVMVLDAIHWVPQSRLRVFVVGVDDTISLEGIEASGPNWTHTKAVLRLGRLLPKWVWWSLPTPRARTHRLESLVDPGAPVDDKLKAERNLSLIPPAHYERLRDGIASGQRVFPGYKRTRKGRQVLELRFDGVAGCLRTPRGGSSRQLLVLSHNGSLDTRLITVAETASLMGVRPSYRIPGSYNDGYRAMGDGLAVPVVRHLARHLLARLAERA